MGVIVSLKGKSANRAGRLDLKDQIVNVQEVGAVQKELDVRKRISVLQAESGTRLYFRLQVANKGSEPVTQVVIDSPIPDRTSYIADTAGGGKSEVLFSVNGGKTYANARELESEGASQDGVTQVRVAEPDMYSDVRWIVAEIQPGRMAEMYYQVHVKTS